MDKTAIIRNFSRYADIYDKYAHVQKASALRLLEQIKEDNFKKILEVGCGTGNYTSFLREKFRAAEFKAIDISDRMLKVAQEKLKTKNIEFILADAEDVNIKERFDLITSNACFQWFDNLEPTLMKYKKLLNLRGIISFSIFGPHTYKELRTSLGYLFKDAAIR